MNTLEEENAKLRSDLNDAKELIDLYFTLCQDQTKLIINLEENSALIYERFTGLMKK